MSIFKRIMTLGRDDLYEQGMALYNRNCYADAIERFEKLLSAKPSPASLHNNLARFYCGQAHRNIGILLFAAGNFAAALERFQAARTFNQQHIDICHFIGLCQNNLGQFDAALETFREILTIDPENVPIRLRLGAVLQNLHLWDRASDMYREVLQNRPGYADVHYSLGLALTGQGRYAEAADAFDAAVEINPWYVEARKKLAIVLLYLKDYHAAEQHLAAITDRFPAYADLHYCTGVARMCNGNLDGAAASFDQALALNPAYVDVLVKYGILECRRGDPGRAIALLEQAVAHEPVDDTVRSLLSLLQRAQRQPEMERLLAADHERESLIRECNRQIIIHPDVSTLLPLIRHFSDEDSSLCEALIPLLQTYIREHPDYPDLHNTLGGLYRKLGRICLARDAFCEAVRINPKYEKARINLLQCLVQLDAWDQAREVGAGLLDDNVTYPDVCCLLAQICLATDQATQAETYAQMALERNHRYAEAYFLRAQAALQRKDRDRACNDLRHCLANHPPADLAHRAEDALRTIE